MRSRSHKALKHTACFLLGLLAMLRSSVKVGDTELVYEWAPVDFHWLSQESGDQSLTNHGDDVPERNLIAGIEIYTGDAHVLTVPRWRWTSGQPATLLKIQDVKNVEVDPNNRLEHVFDTGKTGIGGSVTPNNLCPAKLVVIDLQTDTMADRYVFSASMVSKKTNFITDLTFHYVQNCTRLASNTDTIKEKLHSLNLLTLVSYAMEDETMKIKRPLTTTVLGDTTMTLSGYCNFNPSFNSMAVSQESKNASFYVAHCAVYQTPTSPIRQWTSASILKSEMTQIKVVADDTIIRWKDSIALCGQRRFWFLTNRGRVFMSHLKDIGAGCTNNVQVWKAFVDESGFPDGVKARLGEPSSSSDSETGLRNGTVENISTNLAIIALCFLISWLSAYSIYQNVQSS